MGSHIIALSKLRPTQITVGMLQVKHKRKRIKALAKRPVELVEFILERPIRVVLGPKGKVYVIDHHHLALALIKEEYETAPMEIEQDLSAIAPGKFWKSMDRLGFVHAFDSAGKKCSLNAIPASLKQLKDDPYRSLAGFVREAGGFTKVKTPFAEFIWADFFRSRIKAKILASHFDKGLKLALLLARTPDAAKLPGYVKTV